MIIIIFFSLFFFVFFLCMHATYAFQCCRMLTFHQVPSGWTLYAGVAATRSHQDWPVEDEEDRTSTNKQTRVLCNGIPLGNFIRMDDNGNDHRGWWWWSSMLLGLTSDVHVQTIERTGAIAPLEWMDGWAANGNGACPFMESQHKCQKNLMLWNWTHTEQSPFFPTGQVSSNWCVL